MSAALQLPTVWAVGSAQAMWTDVRRKVRLPVRRFADSDETDTAEPATSLAFYRRHTEKILRRYLYSSMQVGRAPSVLGDSVGRGWASSRPIKTFEDAIIFVLDVERCLDQLGSLDRQLLTRVVLQEFTQAEAARLLGMSVRSRR
jgi:DNA-directed RNA polymerase specialized sigma24 family protein